MAACHMEIMQFKPNVSDIIDWQSKIIRFRHFLHKTVGNTRFFSLQFFSDTKSYLLFSDKMTGGL